jgi:hypothetical protein
MKTAEEIGAATLARLKAQALVNREAGEALREEIRGVLERQPEPHRLSARKIRALLRLDPQPSLRSVQRRLKEICAKP